MRKVLTLSCFILLFFSDSYAQKTKVKYSKFFKEYYFNFWTFSFGLGTAAYRGDLCGRPECNSFKPVVNIGLNYKLIPHFVIGTELNYFQLKARSSTSSGQNITEFSSQNFDLKLYGRYFYFEEKYRTPTDRAGVKKLNPFVQLGVGVIYYNPVSKIINPAEAPNSLTLAPEKKTYPAYSLMLPVSLGFSYSLSRKVKFLAEGVYNFTFTDYLDNHSGSAGKSIGTNDSYVMVLAKMQFTLGSDASGKMVKKKHVASSDKKGNAEKSKSKSKPLQRKPPSRKAPKRHPKK